MAEAHREEIAKLEALYANNPGGRVFVHLAEALRKAGEQVRARGILEEGLARHPDSASGFVVLGRVQLDLGDVLEARSSFLRVLELDGGNMVALRNLGDLARREGRAREAIEYYRELLARSPSNDEVRELLDALEQTLQAETQLPAAAAAETLTPHAAAPGDTGAPAFVEPEFGVVDIDDLPGDLASFAGLGGDTFDVEAQDVADIELGELGFGESDYDDDVAALFDAEPATVDSVLDAFPASGDDVSEEPLDLLTLDTERDFAAADPEQADEAPAEPAEPAEAVASEEELPPDLPPFEEPDWAEELPPAPGDHLETETMADLYASQGLHERAAEVYRALLRRRPGDAALQAKLDSSESRGDSAEAVVDGPDEVADHLMVEPAGDLGDLEDTGDAGDAGAAGFDSEWTPGATSPEAESDAWAAEDSSLAAGIAADAPWQLDEPYPAPLAESEAPDVPGIAPAAGEETVEPAAEEESSEAWLQGRGSVWAEPPAAEEPETSFAWSGTAGDDAEPASGGPPISEYLQGLMAWKRASEAGPAPAAPDTSATDEQDEAGSVPAGAAAESPVGGEDGLRDAPDFLTAEPWLSGAPELDEGDELILDREEPAAWDTAPAGAGSAPDAPPADAPADPPPDPWASADPWAGPAPAAAPQPEAAPPRPRRNLDPVEDAFYEWYGDPAPSAPAAAPPPAGPAPLSPAPSEAPAAPAAPAASMGPAAPAAPQSSGEAAGEDDEDLAMFRSWLQSLKK
jgi:tetratricopeptide (TPR) repeat protein